MSDPVKLEVASIRVPERLRPVDPATVEMLAASFRERGMDTRIIVRPVAGMPDRFSLIAGAHRLAAAVKCGWFGIDAEIVEADDDEARLIEIDENLVRRELSALDRAIFLVERKAVWEKLHPETAKPGPRKRRSEDVANLATFARFSKEAAARTGISERSVRRATEIAGRLDPSVRDALRLTPLADNQAALKALADLEPEQQVLVGREIAEGRASSLAAAKLAAGLTPRRNLDPDEERFERFLGLWARSGRKLRKRIRDYVRSAAADQVAAPDDADADAGAA